VSATSTSVQDPAFPGDNTKTLGVYTKYTHEYVDLQGNVLASGAPAQNFVRYAEFPGQRLFKKVKFDVNGEMIAV
jgi:hypothetical protein